MDRRVTEEIVKQEGGARRRKERTDGRKTEGEKRKGEDMGPLKEDAARRSQLSHLVVNP